MSVRKLEQPWNAFFQGQSNDQSLKEHIIYTEQAASESMPNGHHRPVGIMEAELTLKLRYQQPHYKGNRISINHRTHRTEIIAENVKDIAKRLHAVQ